MSFPLPKALCGALLALLTLTGACGGEPDAEPSEVQTSAASPSGEGLVFLPVEGQDPERPNYHDFGTVPEGSVLHHSFLLENRDPRPVEIQKIDPACGCTVAQLSKVRADGTEERHLTEQPNLLLRLAPGETMRVALEVDSDEVRQKNRDKLFMVRITSDSITTPFITLECHLIVRQLFQVSPAPLDLREIPMGGGGELTATIKAMGPDLHRVVGVGPLPEGVFAELAVSPMSGDDLLLWTLRAGFEPGLRAGRHNAEIHLETVDPEGAPGNDLVLQLSATATPDIVVRPERLMLRPGAKGGPAEMHAELAARLAGQRLNVTGFSVTGEQADKLEFHAEPYQPFPDGTSPRWNLVLRTIGTPTTANFRGTLVLELDDPGNPRMEIEYVGLGF